MASNRVTNARIQGLYAITPDEPDSNTLNAMLEEAFSAGVRLLQYRRKSCLENVQRREAAHCRQMAKLAGAIMIVNDDLSLAQFVRADGVHWGRHDVPLATLTGRIRAAKNAQGEAFIIGISCYGDFSMAEAAVAAGADYIAFGSVFPSVTKPNAQSASVDLIRRAKDTLGVPVVAIGGITVDNAPRVIEAGADSLAVISGIFSMGSVSASDTITTRVKRFSTLFENEHRYASPI